MRSQKHLGQGGHEGEIGRYLVFSTPAIAIYESKRFFVFVVFAFVVVVVASSAAAAVVVALLLYLVLYLGLVHTGEVFQWISVQLHFKNWFLTHNSCK